MYISIKSLSQSLFFCALFSIVIGYQESHARTKGCASCSAEKTSRKSKHSRYRKQALKFQSSAVAAVMDDLYRGANGSIISPAESDFIKAKGGNSTYGEITPSALTALLQQLSITKKDVLYDLGSGTGKVVMQSYLEFPFKKVVGIELSAQRYKEAQRALAGLKSRGFVDKKRSISFIQGDIVETPYTDATVVYLCSTCFSDDLMTKLAEKFSRLKKGARIVTLKQIPHPNKYRLQLIHECRQAMSWSTPEGSPVYIYKKTK
ncbi:methyltransferase domain-containing protein [Candidatus Dependentiae bacterium]|nr:methyltransferase domain-containing protein [Candidatus Dependentiae bacterium]MCC7414774.1 methyltransferase domain-containing protein [Campylobacterota bacterium]